MSHGFRKKKEEKGTKKKDSCTDAASEDTTSVVSSGLRWEKRFHFTFETRNLKDTDSIEGTPCAGSSIAGFGGSGLFGAEKG